MPREVQGHRVEGDDYQNLKKPGDFLWYDEGRRLLIRCPCGCGAAFGAVVERNPKLQIPEKTLWQWNGDRDKPTLNPSIQYLDGCRWHGYLRDGVFVWV